MKKVYFDNAATTPVDPDVLKAMIPMFCENFGNASATHQIGRTVKAKIEIARRQIASIFNVVSSEIFFTSGGTEANNMALTCALRDLDVKRIITSPIEHHCVLHTLEALALHFDFKIEFLNVDTYGRPDLNQLEDLLSSSQEKTLVTLMHVNNELGTAIPLEKVGEICANYNAYFHSDTVQSVGLKKLDIPKLKLDFMTCSAHKIHGPKGSGFLYVKQQNKIRPLIYGGGQERNMRAGTENTAGIIGLAKALELAYDHIEENKNHLIEIRQYAKDVIKDVFPDVVFNGCPNLNIPKVLSVSFPPNPINNLLLLQLDINGICASSGSACSSGSSNGSHVLQAIKHDSDRTVIRFSFSHNSTKEEVDYLIEVLQKIFKLEKVTSVLP